MTGCQSLYPNFQGYDFGNFDANSAHNNMKLPSLKLGTSNKLPSCTALIKKFRWHEVAHHYYSPLTLITFPEGTTINQVFLSFSVLVVAKGHNSLPGVCVCVYPH